MKIFILQYSPVYCYLLSLRAIKSFTSIKEDNRSVSLFSNRIKWINILKIAQYNELIRQTKQIPFTSRSLKSASRRIRDCSQCFCNSSAAELDSTSSQQNASPGIWEWQRRCDRDTDVVISVVCSWKYISIGWPIVKQRRWNFLSTCILILGKNELNLKYIWTHSSYRAVNTIRHGLSKPMN